MDALVARVRRGRAANLLAGGSPPRRISPKRMKVSRPCVVGFSLKRLACRRRRCDDQDATPTSVLLKVIGVVALSTAGLTVPELRVCLGNQAGGATVTDVMAGMV